MKTKFKHLILAAIVFDLFTLWTNAQPKMELLNRGTIAIEMGGDSVYVGWRMLSSDAKDISFNLYRSTGGAAAVKVNDSLIGQSTNFIDKGVIKTLNNAYFVKPVIDEEEQSALDTFTLVANSPVRQYISIPLKEIEQIPDRPVFVQMGGIADLDGDGDYDYVVKRTFWTDDDQMVDATVKLEAYTNDGDFMWRVDLGPNVQGGGSGNSSCYVVYDLDGDGKAEIAAITAEETTFGDGFTIGDTNGDGKTDYRNPTLYQYFVREGPEFLSIIDGETGAEKARGDWIARGNCTDWGDDRCYRAGSNHMAIGFLEGDNTASVIIVRGIYARMKVETWDFDGANLTKRWSWSNEGLGGSFQGQGFHNRRVGDVDGDGKDEFLHGGITFDDDGTILYADGLGHGDRIHLTDIDPGRPGMEVFTVRECAPCAKYMGYECHDAATGEILFNAPEPVDGDVGRGLTADIDPRFRGLECFAGGGGARWLVDCKGRVIRDDYTMPPVNFGIWWDGDLLREILDGTNIFKWNYLESTSEVIFPMSGTVSITRGAPVSYGDIFGDWREEVIMQSTDYNELRIYTTTIPTDIRIPTFMQDPTYRMSVVSLTSGYLQSTQTGFYTGVDMFVPDSLVPPSMPYKFYAKSYKDSVVLKWDPNIEIDATGYNLYRSGKMNGTFIKINQEIIIDTFYIDNTVITDSVYYYYLTCSDTAFNESVKSDIKVGKPTLNPPFPENFQLKQVEDTVMISWSVIEGRDIDGYNIFRSDKTGGPYEPVNTELIPANQSVYKDVPAPSGKYFYVMRSQESSTLESPNTPELSVITGARILIQAEDGILNSATVDVEHPGFHGTGFANFGSTGSVIFNGINGRYGGEHTLLYRYALGKDNRTGSLIINGKSQPLTMKGTGTWTNYVFDSVKIELKAGLNNTITFSSTGNDFGNLDEITVIALPSSLVPTGIVEDKDISVKGDQFVKTYPNPFSENIYIGFRINNPDHVKIEIYNQIGQRLKVITDLDYTEGYHEVIWNGKDADKRKLPYGIYYYKLNTEHGIAQAGMLIYKDSK